MARAGCRYLKRFVRIPLGFTGSVADVAQADEIIASGDADFVGFGRAMLADQRFVAKQLAGRADQVNRCRGDAFCFRDKKIPWPSAFTAASILTIDGQNNYNSTMRKP